MLTHYVNIIPHCHLLWHVGLPYKLPEDVVGLTKLDGYHDPPMHGLVQVVGTVGGQNDQTIMPYEARGY